MRLFAFLALLIPAIALSNTDLPSGENSVAAISLMWGIPTERVDGTPLEAHEIDGYSIKWRYGNEPTQIISITGGLTLEHIIPDVQAGVYVFQIATVTEGQAGPLSDPISLALESTTLQGAAAPIIRVQLSCENCNLEVK